MKSVVSLGDPVTHTVGWRRLPRDAARYGWALQETVKALSRAPYPRGVFRFRSHEEVGA